MLRSAFARLISNTGAYNVADGIFRRLGNGFILAYHDLSAERFERQIDALRPNQPVHLSELLNRANSGLTTAGLFAVTVDDGVGQTVQEISSICTKRHWPVTFYLPTAYIDGEPLPFHLWAKIENVLPNAVITLPCRTLDLLTPTALARFKHEVLITMYTQTRDHYEPLIQELIQWLSDQKLVTQEEVKPPDPISWDEVKRLSAYDQISFQSHGVTHTAVSALADNDLRRELETSKQHISERTGRECQHFCYPYGGKESVGTRAPAIVASIYETAVTMSRGRIRGRAPSLLPRIPIYERDDDDVVRLKTLTV